MEDRHPVQGREFGNPVFCLGFTNGNVSNIRKISSSWGSAVGTTPGVVKALLTSWVEVPEVQADLMVVS